MLIDYSILLVAVSSAAALVEILTIVSLVPVGSQWSNLPLE